MQLRLFLSGRLSRVLAHGWTTAEWGDTEKRGSIEIDVQDTVQWLRQSEEPI